MVLDEITNEHTAVLPTPQLALMPIGSDYPANSEWSRGNQEEGLPSNLFPVLFLSDEDGGDEDDMDEDESFDDMDEDFEDDFEDENEDDFEDEDYEDEDEDYDYEEDVDYDDFDE
ncbi:MAG: hypothetical protein FWC65_02300 [Treponema sp.]|nr:hypothetical protein [Treponema sp.]